MALKLFTFWGFAQYFFPRFYNQNIFTIIMQQIFIKLSRVEKDN